MADTFASGLESKFEAFQASQEPSGNQPPASAEAPSAEGQANPEPTQGTEPTNGKPAEPETPEIGLPGIETPKKEETPPTDASATAPPKIELKMPGETVVGTLNGEPVTASQLQNGFMAHSDYTRKTQEFAEFKKQAEPAVQFVQANEPILRQLGEGAELIQKGDERGKQLVIETVTKIAKDYGVDLQEHLSAGPTRDPDTGRFVAQSKADAQAELESIKAEFGEDSVAYRTAVRNQELEGKLDKLTGQFEQFTGGLQKAQQAAQSQAEMQQLAESWKAKGVTVDPQAALSLVGQPMTVAQALQIANFPQVVEWFMKQKAQRPNEPVGSQQAPGRDASGRGFTNLLEEKFANFAMK